MRFEIRNTKDWLKERLDLAAIWRWNLTILQPKDGSPFRIKYLGRKKNVNLAEILLDIKHESDLATESNRVSVREAIVSEVPIPGAIRVPKYLRAIVPLNRSVDEIVAEYDSELRSKLRKLRPQFHMRQITDDQEIDFAEHMLLRPFASARHGSAVNHMPSETVRSFAKGFGRLDFVYKEQEVVSCLLGMGYYVGGKHYWIVDRFGYPEAVFSDSKRFADMNSMNNHMALEWAIQEGYDFYDIGLVFARPWDGLLQWKKRRGSIFRVTALKGFSYFYVKVKNTDSADFFWDFPLFAVENGGVALHLGLPSARNEEEFLSHYSKMTFRELNKVYLHCATTPAETLLVGLNKFYRHDQTSPKIEIALYP
jgi:hypothetical protein